MAPPGQREGRGLCLMELLYRLRGFSHEYQQRTEVDAAGTCDTGEANPSRIEDCGEAWEHDIWAVSQLALAPAWLLTRMPKETAGEYYASIRSNPIALRVKLADIADNADESRLALLDEKTAARLRKKYQRAIAALTA